MKTYMPLDGFRWSCDSDSALCDMRQTNVLGRAGGGLGQKLPVDELDALYKYLA